MLKKQIIIYLLLVVIFCVAGILYFFIKNKPEEAQVPSVKILTQKEIQEALSKKMENPEKPMSEKEINQALRKEISPGERSAPLTEEEIQRALQAR